MSAAGVSRPREARRTFASGSDLVEIVHDSEPATVAGIRSGDHLLGIHQ